MADTQPQPQPTDPTACDRCGFTNFNRGGKRKRRFYMVPEYKTGRVCGPCVHIVRPGAKAT